MRRIDRYIMVEVCVPALVGVVMLLVLLVGNELYGLLQMLYNGVPGGQIGLILIYMLPQVLLQAVPGSLMLGTALSLNRLERDREILALRMMGVRLTRIVMPLILLGLAFSVGIFFLSEKVIPHTTHEALKIKRKLAWGSTVAIIPHDVVFRIGEHYLYVQDVDPATETLRNVLIAKMEPSQVRWFSIPIAQYHQGKWTIKPDPATNTPIRFWTFNKMGDMTDSGDSLDAGLMDMTEELWKQDVWQYLAEQPTTPDELTLRELRKLQGSVRGIGVGMTTSLALDPAQMTFFVHKKLAIPLSALVAVLIAIPLAVRYGRSGGYVGLLVSVLLAFCFVVSQQWMQVLALKGLIHPVLGAWLPDGVFGLFGLALLFKSE